MQCPRPPPPPLNPFRNSRLQNELVERVGLLVLFLFFFATRLHKPVTSLSPLIWISHKVSSLPQLAAPHTHPLIFAPSPPPPPVPPPPYHPASSHLFSHVIDIPPHLSLAAFPFFFPPTITSAVPYCLIMLSSSRPPAPWQKSKLISSSLRTRRISPSAPHQPAELGKRRRMGEGRRKKTVAANYEVTAVCAAPRGVNSAALLSLREISRQIV